MPGSHELLFGISDAFVVLNVLLQPWIRLSPIFQLHRPDADRVMMPLKSYQKDSQALVCTKGQLQGMIMSLGMVGSAWPVVIKMIAERDFGWSHPFRCKVIPEDGKALTNMKIRCEWLVNQGFVPNLAHERLVDERQTHQAPNPMFH